MNTMSVQEEDRLSSLPNDTLITILSSLPTKQAVSTSILSKRWIHLWRSVPILNLLDTKIKNKLNSDSFNKFINTNVLYPEAYANSHSIHTFLLNKIKYSYTKLYNRRDVHGQENLFYINNWATHVVERNKIQYLTLEGIHNGCRSLATSILSCKTLVVLKLSRFHMNKLSSFPLISFPSLKTLNLKDTTFDQCQDIMLLLDGCPVLEDLQLSHIDFPYGYRGSIDLEPFENSSLRKLNRADITDCDFRFPVKALSNLEFLRIYLYRGSNHPNGFPTFHNLTHLVVKCDCELAGQILQHCPKLQNLEFYPRSSAYSGCSEKDYITKDDQENQTECLSFSLTTCTIRDAGDSRLENIITLATFILKNAKVLETMTIWSNGKRLSVIDRVLSSFMPKDFGKM